MQAQKIIVIHPGSMNLRIGRASDLNPITILHAIGRRRHKTVDGSKSAIPGHFDTLLPPLSNTATLSEFEEQRLQVSHAIQAHVPVFQERGRLRVATPPQQIATFNRRSLPEELSPDHPSGAQVKLEPDTKQQDILFDRALLSLSEKQSADYNIHFPMRRGEFNLHAGIGGSMTSLLADLQAIWMHALEVRLGISPATLPQYSAVLLITDIYDRCHLRELVTLLLQKMLFRSCFLLQDHVAATFGAGVGYACVVDIGDQKCSVSCVEDGISQPDTRVRLSYGGGDVTQVFQMLLRKCSFPYKECDVAAGYADAALMQALKERFCHVSLDVCGAQERTFVVNKSGGRRLRYTIQLGDECIVAPLSLFYPELLNITGSQKQARVQLHASQQPDAEDCFDSEYIRETGRRNGGRDQLLEGGGTLPVTGETGDDDLVVVDAYDAAERDAANAKNGDKEDCYMYNSQSNGQIVSLDQAIVRSIERCVNDEMKRKMYACILLVGGGIKFPGFAKWMEQKVTLHLAATSSSMHRSAEMTSAFEVNVYIKEMDSAMIAWKGAAIMSCLESAPELWINAGEWEKYGLRILREKAPFLW